MIFSFLSRWSQLTALRRVLLIGIALSCLLLFVKEPGPEQHRLWRDFWNCGHLFLFCGFGFLFGERCLRTRAWVRFVGLLIAAALIGWVIELIQRATGRDYSLGDVLADTVGMAIGLLVGGQAALRRSLIVFVAAWAVTGTFLSAQLLPVGRAAIDAVAAARAFPELANFASGFAPVLQVERFAPLRSSYSLVDGALRIDMFPAQYAGFILDDFPNDWRGWHVLHVDLTNPGPPQRIACRLHDAEHERRGYAFTDRFNAPFELATGRNRLTIDLDVAVHAPRDRLMHLGHIRNFGCFIIDLKVERALLLHALWLEEKPAGLKNP